MSDQEHRSATRSKVPQITALFWITKILTTGMGETTSDFVVTTIEPVVGVAIAFVLLAGALVLQFRTSRYVPWVYWLTVVLVSVFGTMAADVVHVQFAVPYETSTVGFAIALVGLFLVWYRTERTLSIHSINTPRREMFYWATVLTTFALGTAAGDWAAHVLRLGYLGSGILFLAAICIPAIVYRYVHVNAVATFWTGYVLTRPLGASFADWVGVSPERGGIGAGTGAVSLALTAAIVICVALLSRQRAEPESTPAIA
ncbi:hypothetical protein CVS47_00340 [Microbacterium lemovicicum]|uniref:Membrane-anchored protein n=1 Tax=Microbacterium lemovicicum TaxID=1072463 RepID=A0A3Q9IW76_9MICO|nr:hypothetical protein [Microbacterium lemovicicum]AZS35743.1 hypothetical protein CVS47_00340 [Microbacterium lemovicicum]